MTGLLVQQHCTKLIIGVTEPNTVWLELDLTRWVLEQSRRGQELIWQQTGCAHQKLPLLAESAAKTPNQQTISETFWK